MIKYQHFSSNIIIYKIVSCYILLLSAEIAFPNRFRINPDPTHGKRGMEKGIPYGTQVTSTQDLAEALGTALVVTHA